MEEVEEEEHYDRSDRSRRRARKQTRPLAPSELTTMLAGNSPAEILNRISSEDNVLEQLLQDRRMSPVPILKVLSKSLDGTENLQRTAVDKVIQTFVQDGKFLERLDSYISTTDEETLEALLRVMKCSLQKLPNRAQRAFYFTHDKLIQPLQEKFKHNEKMRNLFTEVYRMMKRPDIEAKRKEEERRIHEMRQYDVELEPGEFRALSIVPTNADFDPEQELQYRANKIVGAFQNVNDYLDIQFRLLRADLILPLRDSILEFQAQGGEEHKHFKAVKVYTHVRIVRPVCHDKGLCFRLSFDACKLQVNWSVSQRLKYGSLLCLSADNFQTYRCAVVENRDPSDLEKGLVDVQFINQADGPAFQVGRPDEFMTLVEEDRSLRYVMVESPTYFEAYKHVLQSLQNTTEDSFPFWRYIGQCRPQIDPPQYLVNQDAHTTMDLRPLVDKKFQIKDNGNQDGEFSTEAEVASAVAVRDRRSWPNRNYFNLDTSQFCALQSALTREFALIQGPPGTGKTYLGLLLMRVFLHNRNLWSGLDGQQTPILLVCYTNHALDQFLEGILEFFDGKLVRVGSRSQSTLLEPYNLRSVRNKARENRLVPMDIHLGKVDIRTQMKSLKAKLHLVAAKLEILEREIVTLDFLKDIIHPHHMKGIETRNQTIPDWLGITSDIKKIEADGRKRQKQERQRNPHLTGGAGGRDGVHEDSEEEEEEEEDEDDLDLLQEANRPAGRNLDIDDDDDFDDEEIAEDDFDLFAELAVGVHERFENVRKVNKLLDETDAAISKLQQESIAFNISTFGEENPPRLLSKEEKKFQKSLTSMKKRYRSLLLNNMQKTDRFDEDMAMQVYNVWKIKRSDRWRLYRYWVDLYCRQLRGEIRDQSQEYERLARRYQELLHQEDYNILRKATVIGMTTTAAARYQAVLREIGPKIVLVEEAAEVLEGHVIASLSAESQHVILIGDHKQLRPNPSVYKLKSQCGLDISLFERLVRNDFPLDVLEWQHRMRPEISQLLKVPDLYPDLKDDDSVKKYGNILGVDGNVCFIHHEIFEDIEGETTTFKNDHEAWFVIGLFQYLVQQGYASKRITILSPYAGQTHLIKQLLEYEGKLSKKMKQNVKGVKVTSVDNFQGEENDIIILSLVRSNEENKIGFLKENNRLCVALSRAKMGLYVIGNLIGLSSVNELFREILQKATERNFFSDHLNLLCARHKGKVTEVTSYEDFKHVPEGGCNLPCGGRLNCGHFCSRICHTDDEKHTEGYCEKECRAFCEACDGNCDGSHPCRSHVRCENPTAKRLPNCNHQQVVPCYMDPNQFECKEVCTVKLPCEHQCTKSCGCRHTHTLNDCTVVVEVESETCGHKFKAECRLTQSSLSDICTEPCGTVLECEHVCRGTCGECHNGRLHTNCQEPCKKILICGHKCEAMCSDCPPCSRPCETECQCNSKCMKKCGEICAPCVEKCQWTCEHESCPDLCCQPCERPPCDLPCPKRRRCGHLCSGLCGEKCPRLCVICPADQEELRKINYEFEGDPTTVFVELDCGHAIDVDFMDQWMATSTSTDEDSGQQSIGLKTCPYCTSPVRKCNRYNKQIKSMLQLIERVKRKYIGAKETVTELQQRRTDVIEGIQGRNREAADNFIANGFEVPSATVLECQINQLLIFQQVCALHRLAEELEHRWPQRGHTFRSIQADLERFKSWSLKKRSLYSTQNKEDAQREHGRLSTLLALHRYCLNIQNHGVGEKLSTQQTNSLMDLIKTLSLPKVASESDIMEGKKLCKELKDLVPSSNIWLTSEEKLQIVQAMNLQKGAWYKCPKDHIYAIGECGQAMETSTCPECKATIGGTNHALDQTNSWAPEMDNAEVPIWNNLAADRQLAEQLQRQFDLDPQAFP